MGVSSSWGFQFMGVPVYGVYSSKVNALIPQGRDYQSKLTTYQAAPFGLPPPPKQGSVWAKVEAYRTRSRVPSVAASMCHAFPSKPRLTSAVLACHGQLHGAAPSDCSKAHRRTYDAQDANSYANIEILTEGRE